MKVVLAISGGVDSMVLLDSTFHTVTGDDEDIVYSRAAPLTEIIVAHFNHGTRPSADTDQKFVERIAKKYGLRFVVEKANLGENVSEAAARTARYEFLRRVAAENDDAVIMTGHHLNDLVESIAINLIRGTGWRGLAVFSDRSINRAQMFIPKTEILQYAALHHIVFRQDPTNADDRYLRNRIRDAVSALPYETLMTLCDLAGNQNYIAERIENKLAKILPKDGTYERHWFTDLDDAVALEILRYACQKAGISATRPQLADFLHAIRTYPPGKTFNLPKDRLIKLGKDKFVI